MDAVAAQVSAGKNYLNETNNHFSDIGSGIAGSQGCPHKLYDKIIIHGVQVKCINLITFSS